MFEVSLFCYFRKYQKIRYFGISDDGDLESAKRRRNNEILDFFMSSIISCMKINETGRFSSLHYIYKLRKSYRFAGSRQEEVEQFCSFKS